jgi:hypothetical protein
LIDVSSSSPTKSPWEQWRKLKGKRIMLLSFRELYFKYLHKKLRNRGLENSSCQDIDLVYYKGDPPKLIAILELENTFTLGKSTGEELRKSLRANYKKYQVLSALSKGLNIPLLVIAQHSFRNKRRWDDLLGARALQAVRLLDYIGRLDPETMVEVIEVALGRVIEHYAENPPNALLFRFDGDVEIELSTDPQAMETLHDKQQYETYLFPFIKHFMEVEDPVAFLKAREQQARLKQRQKG